MPSYTFKLYSPRWGQIMSYPIEFSRERMSITNMAKRADCSWVENRDPAWSGHNQDIGHPLINILGDDSIYAPAELPSALDYLWQAWRDEEIDETEVESQIEELANWINRSTDNQPKSEFWSIYFG